jgi:uncharacterized protein (TIGR03435 family)
LLSKSVKNSFGVGIGLKTKAKATTKTKAIDQSFPTGPSHRRYTPTSKKTARWGPRLWQSGSWQREQVGAESAIEPYYFTAIQEQLRLRLMPTKGHVDYVVIDHIEMPSEN